MIDIGTQFHMHDGKMTVQRTQDCGPIAEHCKQAQNEGRHGTSEMKHAASIPYVILEQYCNNHNITFRECMLDKVHMKRILNDPGLQAFRIWPGKV